MSNRFITIGEAVKLSGKSRRTIQRLVQTLAKAQPEQVMQEKTSRGYIWRINEQSVRQAFGVSAAMAPLPKNDSHPLPLPAPTPPPQFFQLEKYMETVGQGYSGIMTMHEEVKQVYEERLKDKDIQIARLAQDLAQARKGLWARWFRG